MCKSADGARDERHVSDRCAYDRENERQRKQGENHEAWLRGDGEAYKRKLTTLKLDKTAASLLQREADQGQRCSKQSMKVDKRDKIGQVARPGLSKPGLTCPPDHSFVTRHLAASTP